MQNEGWKVCGHEDLVGRSDNRLTYMKMGKKKEDDGQGNGNESKEAQEINRCESTEKEDATTDMSQPTITKLLYTYEIFVIQKYKRITTCVEHPGPCLRNKAQQLPGYLSLIHFPLSVLRNNEHFEFDVYPPLHFFILLLYTSVPITHKLSNLLSQYLRKYSGIQAISA